MSSRVRNWREQVLKVLRGQDGAMTAYEVMDELRTTNPKIAPATVYRALRVLLEQGLIHRLESINAFAACQHKRHKQTPVLSVCGHCGAVEETIAPGILAAISKPGTQTGFVASRPVIELHGCCIACDGERGE